MEKQEGIIKINDRTRIKKDQYNFTVQTLKTVRDKETGKIKNEYWENVPAPHHGSLEFAFEKLLKFNILNDKEKRSIESLKEYIKECKNEIVQAIRERREEEEG